jgi:hypothetical protein
MSEKRPPPAYQEYAATMLAKFEFRALNLEQRGLLYTLRLECWENKSLPRDAIILTKVLGQPVSESALKAIQPFFKFEDNSITSPELDNYKLALDERREKQRKGGQKGAKVTNSRSSKSASAKTESNPRVPRQGSGESLVKSKPEKQSQNQRYEGKSTHRDDAVIDPLDSELHTPASECGRCFGEGCGWCDG